VHLPALQHPSLLDSAAALPHVHGLSPARSTTAAPPRPGPIGGRCAQPAHPLDAGEQGKIRSGSRVHCGSLDEGGARLCPCGLAASTPQTFLAASLAARAHRRGSSLPVSGRCAPPPAQIHQVSSWRRIKGVSHAGSSRTPLRPASRTRTIWQYWLVPALSGLLPPSPAPPGSGCPQLRRPAATRSAAKVSHLHSNHSASRRTHDLRHSFAVATLLDWYRDGGDVAARLPLLSTYLGHVEPANTYWYLHAAPELLAQAAHRLDAHLGLPTQPAGRR
jgi:hypothetical protein